ncbi:MAG: bifunctional glutamate N-acetyltransferase/amino-acid acetyltransferase ArgJ [Oleiphilaceae bacterium]|nr:bifunctional glutamate N-acetyltransferase/amino-acid acetyltransferase ArgJ [Oleiphilaceae bacterium]
MAIGEAPLPEFHPVAGVRLGIAAAAIKKAGRDDLVVLELSAGSQVAAVFTRNRFCAAPVLVAREHLQSDSPRYLLINTGNANAGNGEQGMRDARRCCEALAVAASVSPQQVLPFSTGVIGEPLPVPAIEAGIPEALASLKEHHWARAASGIMTTDTRPKGATRRVLIGGEPVHISGISKGAGMIRPNMATMLAFVATDAAIDPSLLQTMVSELAEESFNRITVDGDTSTNDACVVAATGQSPAPALAAESSELPLFREALLSLLQELSQAIVRDAEGATKFVTVTVNEAANREQALKVAYAVAESPLVKTALYACDPNWGRILAAVGRAGVDDLDVAAVSIYLDEVCIVRQGGRDPDYREALGQQVMDRSEIGIHIQLGMGTVRERVWTCDFSHEYVTINAEYRT